MCQILSCLCALTCCGISITFIVYLGIYGLNNPDKEAWYGVDVQGEGALFETNNSVGAESKLINIHGKFVLWFLWGFIFALSTFAATPIMMIASCIHEMLGKVLGGILTCGLGCGGLAWWIAGIVWRFNTAGAYASGDLLPADAFAELAKDNSSTLY